MGTYTRQFQFQDGAAADGGQVRSELDQVADGINKNVLGYAEVTANQAGIVALTDLTGLTITFTVHDRGRRVRIYADVFMASDTVNGNAIIYLLDGGSQVQVRRIATPSANLGYGGIISYVTTPTTGSHTYKLSAAPDAGSLTLAAAATYPNFILAELI